MTSALRGPAKAACPHCGQRLTLGRGNSLPAHDCPHGWPCVPPIDAGSATIAVATIVAPGALPGACPLCSDQAKPGFPAGPL